MNRSSGDDVIMVNNANLNGLIRDCRNSGELGAAHIEVYPFERKDTSQPKLVSS